MLARFSNADIPNDLIFMRRRPSTLLRLGGVIESFVDEKFLSAVLG
jgi:hypothetical protein